MAPCRHWRAWPPRSLRPPARPCCTAQVSCAGPPPCSRATFQVQTGWWACRPCCMVIGHWSPCSTFGLSQQYAPAVLGEEPDVLKCCAAGIPPLMGLIADLSELHLRGGQEGVLRAALELLAALLGEAGPQASLGGASTLWSVLATSAAVRSLAARTSCAAGLSCQAGHPAFRCLRTPLGVIMVIVLGCWQQ